MIARRISSKLPVLAYHPPKVFDPDYFNHIHAAGALPILDTEFFANTDIIQMIEQLGQTDVIFERLRREFDAPPRLHEHLGKGEKKGRQRRPFLRTTRRRTVRTGHNKDGDQAGPQPGRAGRPHLRRPRGSASSGSRRRRCRTR